MTDALKALLEPPTFSNEKGYQDAWNAGNVIIRTVARFDDETWYGFNELWVKVKEDNRLPPLKYERFWTLEIR